MGYTSFTSSPALEGAVQVKLVLWRAARCGFDRNAYMGATY